MHAKYPCKWMADVRNNGKMLALFDKAQQDRNAHYKVARNVTELMLIYNIGRSKQSSLQVLNMRQLLLDEEVLNFGFDDFNDSFTCIMVQAKNLFLYQVDFNKHEVLRKTASNNTQCK